ncbi:hypothetical protein A8950_3030 [Dongia mobilis]|uniref:Uncharacterized protein n=1 Tax=Dongia mobilis TaxID=578943 RepID=A0A4R6WMX3_9PROT|nr:hypothetical protein [Dongia mobilis]TDQ80499.1 hypothetical protein A8950_3030 [Dongia mobilis]
MAAASQEGIFKLKPWTIAVPVILLGLFFLPVSVVLLAAHVPTIVARIVDTSPGRRLTITVGAMNLLGSLYFLDQIIAVGAGIEDIGPTLANSFGWLYALTGAGAGWVLFGMMTPIVTRLAGAQSALRLRRVAGAQDKLVAEWGEAVRGPYAMRVEAEEGEAAGEG